MMAARHRLEEICVIIDFNRWQATGRSDEVTALEPLKDKWVAFGWQTKELDGHDMAALRTFLDQPADGSGRPVVLIAHTVKGKGVSFMEDDNNWHYRVPKECEVNAAKMELGLA